MHQRRAIPHQSRLCRAENLFPDDAFARRITDLLSSNYTVISTTQRLRSHDV